MVRRKPASVVMSVALAGWCGGACVGDNPQVVVEADAGVDATVDASHDTSTDAGVDAPTDAACLPSAIDVGGDPVVAGQRTSVCTSTMAAVPGTVDGSIFYCDFDPRTNGDGVSTVVRQLGDAAPEVDGPFARTACSSLLALDDHRSITAMSTTSGPWPRHAIVVITDFAAHTSRSAELPAPSGRAAVWQLQAIPDGVLANGVMWSDQTETTPTNVMWQLDRAGVVVRTWLGVAPGVVVPSPTLPVVLARVDGSDRVTWSDLASGDLIGSAILPLQIDHLEAGPQGVVAFGASGCDFATAPIGATVATVLPGVAADRVRAGFDDRGRVVVVEDLGDDHTVAMYRIDDARFDGLDGASRLDPTLGPARRARAEYGLPCVSGDLCAPGVWHERTIGLVVSAGTDRVVVCGTFTDLAPGHWIDVPVRYRMP